MNKQPPTPSGISTARPRRGWPVAAGLIVTAIIGGLAVASPVLAGDGHRSQQGYSDHRSDSWDDRHRGDWQRDRHRHGHDRYNDRYDHPRRPYAPPPYGYAVRPPPVVVAPYWAPPPPVVVMPPPPRRRGAIELVVPLDLR